VHEEKEVFIITSCSNLFFEFFIVYEVMELALLIVLFSFILTS